MVLPRSDDEREDLSGIQIYEHVYEAAAARGKRNLPGAARIVAQVCPLRPGGMKSAPYGG